MKTKTLLTLAALTLVFTSPTFGATTVLSDNFDGYADQAAFDAAWTPIGTVAPIGGSLSTDQAVSLSYSVKNSGTTVTGNQRNRATFTETGVPSAGNVIAFSFDFYDSTGTGNPQRNFCNIQDTTAPSGSGQLISLGLNNNLLGTDQGGNYYMARLLGGSANGGAASAFFKLNDPAAPLRSLGWHNLKVEISDTAFNFYVDNTLSETVANTFTLRSYDNVTLGSGLSNGSTDAYFDNVLVQTVQVPEPSSVALCLLGGLGLTMGRIFRRSRG